MRVLIVLPGALGDVVRALPFLGRLRRGWPQAHLAWVVEPLSAPVLQGHPWLDEVLVFPRRDGVVAVGGFLRQVRAAGFDVALDLGRGAKSALVTWASRAPRRIGFARADGREGSWLVDSEHLPPQGVERSKLAQFLAFGDLLQLPTSEVSFGLAPTDAEVEEAAAFTTGLRPPLIALSVGSSCPSRRWFPEPTAQVVRTLAMRHHASAVLLGTAADANFALAVARAAGDVPLRDLVGRTSVRQLMAVLARARLAVGPDSGALHLAAAVGTRVVSLWGPTSAGRSAPAGSETFVVHGEATCAPCFLKTCPIGRVCMQSIAAETVLAKAEAALAA